MKATDMPLHCHGRGEQGAPVPSVAPRPGCEVRHRRGQHVPVLSGDLELPNTNQGENPSFCFLGWNS